MMKKKILYCLLASLALGASIPNTTLASSNVEIYAEKKLVLESCWITAKATYISKNFLPTTNKIQFLFNSGGGGTGNYTCYIEERNNNGSWSVSDSYICKEGVSTNFYVTPGCIYRVRIVSTKEYKSQIRLEVFENVQ